MLRVSYISAYCLVFFGVTIRRPTRSTRTYTLFPDTTLRRSADHLDPAVGFGELHRVGDQVQQHLADQPLVGPQPRQVGVDMDLELDAAGDRQSTRLNSSH